MTIKEYYKELENHDWYYSFSDDDTMYKRGYENELKLKKMAENLEKYQNLYAAFSAYKFSGNAWGTKRKLKPKLKDFK